MNQSVVYRVILAIAMVSFPIYGYVTISRYAQISKEAQIEGAERLAVYEEQRKKRDADFFRHPKISRPFSYLMDKRNFYDVLVSNEGPADSYRVQVTGQPVETLKYGSIFIDIPVSFSQFKTNGNYDIKARVYDATGKPIALLTPYGKYDPSTRKISLLIYGIVIRDEQGQGPFTVKDIDIITSEYGNAKGYSELVRRRVQRLDMVYTTKNYPIDSFTNARFDSFSAAQQAEMISVNSGVYQ